MNHDAMNCVEAVRRLTGVDVSAPVIIGFKSERRISARELACVLFRERTALSYPEIAPILGYRSHSSAAAAARRGYKRQDVADFLRLADAELAKAKAGAA